MNEQDFLRVLVADLDAESLQFGDIEDCHIIRCRTGEAALKRLERAQFDVVLVDQELPDVSGLELMRHVLTCCPEATRVLLMSGATMRTATHAINDVNIHHLFDKPLNLALLRNVFDTAKGKAFARRRYVELLQRVEDQNRALERLNRQLGSVVSARTLALLEALMAALEYRDTETRWHVQRVALYCHTMASLLGLQGRELEDIVRGALLHDIGKIGIPDAIVLKPSALTEDEWALMRAHPLLGSELLEHIDFLSGARQLVLEHHERFDGAGYPHGIAGLDICIGARLFAVADTVDAMTSVRPHRRPVSWRKAREEVKRGRGSQFDPAVIDVFCSIPSREWEAAIRVGNAEEMGLEIPPEVLDVWLASCFARGFEAADGASIWDRLTLFGAGESSLANL